MCDIIKREFAVYLCHFVWKCYDPMMSSAKVVTSLLNHEASAQDFEEVLIKWFSLEVVA